MSGRSAGVYKSASNAEVTQKQAQQKPPKSEKITSFSSVWNSQKVSKESGEQKRACKVVFTIGSPDRCNGTNSLDDGVEYTFGEFLKTCRWCKKELTEKDDIFMSGYFRAFCNPECREKDILLNEEKERASSKSSVDLVEGNWKPSLNLWLHMTNGLQFYAYIALLVSKLKYLCRWSFSSCTDTFENDECTLRTLKERCCCIRFQKAHIQESPHKIDMKERDFENLHERKISKQPTLKKIR